MSRYDHREVKLEKQRAIMRPAPAAYGGPLVAEATPATGVCPACWLDIELNMAGRIRPHGDGCPGIGQLPRTVESELKREIEVPASVRWWRRPTCQECGAYLKDSKGNPRWEVTAAIAFVCLGGCRRSTTTVQQLIAEGSIR